MIKQHGEDAKQDIASVEFAGKIVKMEKGCISIKLAETLPFHKVLPIEYPYTYMMIKRVYCGYMSTKLYGIMPK